MTTMYDIVRSGRYPTHDELAQFYETQANPRPGDGWTPSNHHIDRGYGRTQFALAHIESGMSVLEVGSLDGGVTIHLLDAVGGMGTLDYLDISPTYVHRTASYLAAHPHYKSSRGLVGNVCNWQPDHNYDVVVAMEVLEHIPDPRQALRVMFACLTAKGKILVTVPLPSVMDSEGEHVHQFTEKDLIQIIGEATGIRAPIWRQWDWFFTVIEKDALAYKAIP